MIDSCLVENSTINKLVPTPKPKLFHQTSSISIGVNEAIQKRCNLTVRTIYKRLHVLQNPKNCTTARKLICDGWNNGMGSILHHWVDCFIYAYHTNRTMLLDLRKWAYLKNHKTKEGLEKFEDLFQPISKCQYEYNSSNSKNEVMWSTALDKNPDSEVKAVRLIHIYNMLIRSRPLPITTTYTMPNDILDRIINDKHEPMAWWIGLMASYIIRPSKELKKFIKESITKFKYQSPIVGVHIRRADKVSVEAKNYSVHAYMKHVVRFYNNLAKHKKIDKNRVFVCTDEAKVIPQLKSLYPNYTFIHPPVDEITGDYTKLRYSAQHLKYFLRDINLLALSDYLVVTMTSNVGRLAYELHELYNIESHSRHFTSLDADYHLYHRDIKKNGPTVVRAITNCSAINLTYIDICIGDILDYDPKVKSTKDKYYGYSRRLKKYGYFSSKCVKFVINKWNYRNYSQMDSITRPEDKKNMPHIIKNWGQFYCSKNEMIQ